MEKDKRGLRTDEIVSAYRECRSTKGCYGCKIDEHFDGCPEAAAAVIESQAAEINQLKSDIENLRNRAKEAETRPTVLHFGSGMLGVGVCGPEGGPLTEIAVHCLDCPIPIGKPTGLDGTDIDDVKNLRLRMYFHNAESAEVLHRKIHMVLKHLRPKGR